MDPAQYGFLLLRELDHRAGKDVNRRIAERVVMNIVMMRELERLPLRRKGMRHLAREEAERLFDEFLNELGYTRIQYEALDEFTKNQLRRSFVQWLDARRRRQKGDKYLI